MSTANGQPRKINLGASGKLIDEFSNWLCVDREPGVMQHRHPLQHDITLPLPLPDESFDLVFTEHVLEHLDMAEAAGCAAEVYRLLRPGGVVRVVVPDAIRRRNEPPEKFPCRHEHRTAWTVESLGWLLLGAGFDVLPVRCWTEDGRQVIDEQRLALDLGTIRRPKSLIVDGVKPA